MSKALEWELNEVKTRYENGVKWIVDHLMSSYTSPLEKEAIRKLLSSAVLVPACGNYTNKWGYVSDNNGNSASLDTPLGRLEFLRFFVGHELFDDGDPGIGYYRYNDRQDSDEASFFITCEKDEPGAKPFFHRCWELLPPGSQHLHEQEVLDILTWHGEDEKRFLNDAAKWENREPDELERNPLLEALTAEIEEEVAKRLLNQ